MNKQTNKLFLFDKQLKVGDQGEQFFLEHYPRKLEIIKHRYCDFKVKTSNELIELKTDTYDMLKTSNFFFERYSDYNAQSPGSVWQSRPKNVSIFCYLFINNKTWFEFRDLDKLIDRLDNIINDKKLGKIFIQNRGWTTVGYKINRDDLKDLYKVYTISSNSAKIKV